ncbi:MAG TPA: prephenate dehydrogenase/arogenate dehydrogenase family protein [Verrucomicrobia bacterium]|nr:prephenate dehydrogenase/arogenate dehydrogenase family protein [Verrucomicrobiota bacterium]
MNIAIIGRGLIGGSLELAARRAGHTARIFPGRAAERPDLTAYDYVFVAVPPDAVTGVVEAIAPKLKAGATVVDIAGVKQPIYAELVKYAYEKKWYFVGGHPMAGKERTGYANASADLFDGASMILTPYPTYGRGVLDRLEVLLRELGFARIVYTDPQHHDEMIAYTSQLCHLISSAYVRDELAQEHAGYSAGSFRDMVRVGAPDPDVWTELFLSNRAALVPVLSRFIARMTAFKKALEADDRAAIRAALEESVAAKKRMEEGSSK